jgi:chemotaxis protein CheD
MTPAGEIAVRMGELAVSSAPGEVLLSIGLGSCIGLALVDQRRGIAGLAHVMLPEATGGGPAAKFADRAVPELVARTTALGTSRTALRAVLVGGAQMFTLGGGGAGSALDIGVRNESAVRAALAAARIPVLASATGGDRGRTIRVFPGGAVLSKEAGGAEIELMPGVRA